MCYWESKKSDDALFSNLTYVSASALPCDIGTPEYSTLVQCAGNTMPLLQCSRLHLIWAMPPTTPSWTHWLQGLGSHTAAWVIEYESWVKKTEEIKQLVEFRQCTNTAFEWKMQFLCLPVLPGSAEAQIIWGGIVKRLLIAYFIGNISAQKIKTMSKLYSMP